MRLPVIALIVLFALGGCGGSSSGVSEEEAADLIASNMAESGAYPGVKPADPADCVRSADNSRRFECNVAPFTLSTATATVEITVSESGDTYVINSCEQQQAETEELEEIQKDPCRLIR